MSNSHGQFAWYELMTTDVAAAEAFYRKVVGWGAKDAGMPDMTYILFSAGEAQVAGLMKLPDEALQAGGRPGWIGYIEVDDVDACAAKVSQAGGAIHRAPDDIPGVGRFAVAADPQGAHFVLFKGVEGMPPAEPAPMGKPGYTGWHELMAADGAKAFDFYANLFGWTKGEAMDMGADGVYQLFGVAGGPSIGGIMTKSAQVPAPFWGYYFQVDSIKAGIERLTAGGGSVINGPMEVPGGAWIVNGLDPQGAMFSLLGPQG